MNGMKTYLVKGRACIKGRWQNITVPRKGNSPEDAIAWTQYKYHTADTLIIESVYVMVSKEGRARRKALPQMTLEDLNTVKWTCKYQRCDTCYDCETCPAWQPTDGMHEEKDIYEIYYKILPFAGMG